MIPTPPIYNIQKVLDNIYIIESAAEAKQGTAFHMKGVGLISYHHSIAPDSMVFKASDIGKKYPTTILKSHPVIDLAIFNSNELPLNEGLDMGDLDKVRLNDHVAVAGFPNHNHGDTGIFSPGLAIGFRPVSGIRRLLVNTPLIAGNSGGPIISGDGKVIGVAVTGADKMESAATTEDHGVIPISAINLVN